MNFIARLKYGWNSARELGNKLGQSPQSVFWDILKCRLRYNACLEDYLCFELDKKSHRQRKLFLTDRSYMKKIYPVAHQAEYVHFFDNKADFDKLFKDHISRKFIVTADSSENEIRDFFTNNPVVFVKETIGSQGLGVRRIDTSDSASVEKILTEIRNGAQFVIEQPIIQHPGMAEFNPSSVNTLRIETLLMGGGNILIFNTIIIIGGKGSHISNTHSGGVMCHVDPETGIIDSYGRNPEGKRFLKHPQNDVVLLGKKIPHWEKALEYAKTLARVCPQCRFIGWDIAVTPDGVDVVEGNTRPGMCTQACDMKGRWNLIKEWL